MPKLTFTVVKKLYAQIIALSIVVMAIIPFIAHQTPSIMALTIYIVFVAGYFVFSQKIRMRFSPKTIILIALLLLAGFLTWNIATTLPQVVFVFFIAFLISLLTALLLIATLSE